MIHRICNEQAKSGIQLLASQESYVLTSLSNNRYRTEVTANTTEEAMRQMFSHHIDYSAAYAHCCCYSSVIIQWPEESWKLSMQQQDSMDVWSQNKFILPTGRGTKWKTGTLHYLTSLKAIKNDTLMLISLKNYPISIFTAFFKHKISFILSPHWVNRRKKSHQDIY